MTVYRRMMDRLLDRAEDGTAITNPSEPIRTIFRKLAFRAAVWRSKLGRLRHRRSSSKGTEGARK